MRAKSWAPAILAAALLAFQAAGQPAIIAPTSPGIMAPVACTVSSVQAGTCSAELLGVRIVVTDGADATECGNAGDAGGGSFENVCRWSAAGDAWVIDAGAADAASGGSVEGRWNFDSAAVCAGGQVIAAGTWATSPGWNGTDYAAPTVTLCFSDLDADGNPASYLPLALRASDTVWILEEAAPSKVVTFQLRGDFILESGYTWATADEIVTRNGPLTTGQPAAVVFGLTGPPPALEFQAIGGAAGEAPLSDGAGAVSLENVATQTELELLVASVPSDCTPVPEGASGEIQVNNAGVLDSISGVQSVTIDSLRSDANAWINGIAITRTVRNATPNAWELTSLVGSLGNATATTALRCRVYVADANYANRTSQVFTTQPAAADASDDYKNSTSTTPLLSTTVAPGKLVIVEAYGLLGDADIGSCTATWTVTP